MPDEIVLLTGEREAPYLTQHLQVQAPALAIRHVATREALDAAFAVPRRRRRLIAFTTNIVVPGRYIAACDLGAYNFHPGPPTYPGVYPESFAVWEGAKHFGATAHAMVRQVDAGPIVRTEWFDVQPGWGRMYAKRYRAFGEGPFQDLYVLMHGHRYKIVNPWTDADLTREMGQAPPA